MVVGDDYVRQLIIIEICNDNGVTVGRGKGELTVKNTTSIVEIDFIRLVVAVGFHQIQVAISIEISQCNFVGVSVTQKLLAVFEKTGSIIQVNFAGAVSMVAKDQIPVSISIDVTPGDIPTG